MAWTARSGMVGLAVGPTLLQVGAESFWILLDGLSRMPEPPPRGGGRGGEPFWYLIAPRYPQG
jgi:hypothetical protein